MILSGMLFEICAAGLEYKEMIEGGEELEIKFRIVSPYCPFIVPASILFFGGFTLLKLERNFKKLPSITFFIYLIHAGVWDLILKLSYIIIRR